MVQPQPTRIGFIGAGRLAASLAAGLVEAGYCIAAVASANQESARKLASAVGNEVTTSTPQEVAEACDLVFLTVPDTAIEKVAASIKWDVGQAVVHCSGALSLEVLAAAAGPGAAVGCFHPLQSFPSRDGDATRFQGITVGIEAEGALSATLEGIAIDLGALVVRLEGVDRARYHVAAVFASNYVVSLMAAAVQTWERAGLATEAARGALAPLLLGAAQNVTERELRDALTGPIARGDVATVERHLAALDELELEELYRRLGAQLLALDLQHPPEVTARLRALLSEDDQ